MPLAFAPALIAQSAFTLAAAMTAGRQRARAWLSAVFAAGALASPLLMPASSPLLRFLVAVAGLAVAFRALDLARDDRDWSPWQRLWLMTAMVDIRRVERTSEPSDPARWLHVAGYVALAAVGYAVAFEAAPVVGGIWTWPVRWLGGVLFIYGVADAACQGIKQIYATAGMRIPPQHYAPIRAASVGAFWSKHYNLNVSDWLARHFYMPLARKRRPMAGLALAFVVSALFHMWVAWIPLDLPMAAMMGTFFLVQGLVIALERAIGQRRWSKPVRHAWTLAWMLATSPLFVEPFLRIVG